MTPHRFTRTGAAVALLFACSLAAGVCDAAPPRTPKSLRFVPGEVVVIAGEGVFEAGPNGAPRARDGRLAGVLVEFGL